MNHSYHEMVIGQAALLDGSLLSKKQAFDPAHRLHVRRSTWRSSSRTTLALARRRRPVVAILLNDLTRASRTAADDFFSAVADRLKDMGCAA